MSKVRDSILKRTQLPPEGSKCTGSLHLGLQTGYCATSVPEREREIYIYIYICLYADISAHTICNVYQNLCIYTSIHIAINIYIYRAMDILIQELGSLGSNSQRPILKPQTL